MGSKKGRELRNLERARGAGELFPPGEVISCESPDSVLTAPNGLLGIEVTELCVESLRNDSLHHVTPQAKRCYRLRRGARHRAFRLFA